MALRYSHVFWDWNGTLLDDSLYCSGVINGMLRKRGLAELAGVEGYRDVFGFPISDYYKMIGFDFAREPFEDLAAEYIDLYNACTDWVLQDGALETLEAFHAAGIKQAVLSASLRETLISQIEAAGISRFFCDILGMDDIYGAGKLEIAAEYIKRTKIDKAAFIGDTSHDFETAQSMGADPILFSNGHQSRARLLRCGAPVIGRLAEAVPIILGNSDSAPGL